MRFLLATSVILLCCVYDSVGAELPDLLDHWEPTPAPAWPKAFDPFSPPIGQVNPSPEAPGITQWTRTAGPDEHLILAGYNFTSARDPEGKSTRFGIFAQTKAGSVAVRAEVALLDAHQAIIHLPKNLPAASMLLVFPRNAEGIGRPVAVNRAELWYVLPRTAAPGAMVSAYGRNLANRSAPDKAWIYLRSKKSHATALVAASRANPYKVDFTIPADFPHDDYEVWAHNGHGGRFGWSPLHKTEADLAPTSLKVAAPPTWDGPTFNVAELGANGNDERDDTEAILKALKLATAEQRATVYFPAGTYYLSKPIAPVTDRTRLLGAGMSETFLKGHPTQAPKNLVHITGAHVEIRDLVLDFNRLGEKQKFYRDADRGEHNPAHYQWLTKVKAAEVWKKQKANQGKPLPPELEPPPKPEFPEVDRRHALLGKGKPSNDKLLSKAGYAPGLRLINCVFDAERCLIGLNGIVDGTIENCDFVARECQLGVPQYTTIRGCNFYGRADAPVLMYLYGGWCISVHDCTGQDYMPNTFDTCMGRFFTVSAYGNRHENIYVGGNRTKDLTVNPMHFNQNSGEQIMWEFMPIAHTEKPTAVSKDTITFAKPLKQDKLTWYSDAVIVSGKGMGQYRRIAEYDAKSHTITLDRPWQTVPDTDSVIQISRPIRRIVVYDNYLDGKPRAVKSVDHIASAGVEPFGASIDLTVDGNTFHELRAGVATFSPYLFHYYANNTSKVTRKGFSLGNGTGLVARRNQVHDAIEAAFAFSEGGKVTTTYDVVEHNRGQGMPFAVRLGNRWTSEVQNEKLMLYQNRFAHGGNDRESSAIRTSNRDTVILRENQFEGFQQAVGVPSKKD